jgi:DNA-binding NtrC family response regulator
MSGSLQHEQTIVDIACVGEGRRLVNRLRRILPEDHYRIAAEPGLEHVVDRFDSQGCDLVIVTSHALRPRTDLGLEQIEMIATRSPETCMLFIGGRDDARLALAVQEAGVRHCALQPLKDEDLRRLVQKALEERAASGAAPRVTRERTRLAELYGRSEIMQQVYRQIRQAAATEIPVLLEGETGTGKDVAAETLHNQSVRKDGPFVAVHLGALPGELVAGELFGHERGAFTGAMGRYTGKFEQAHTGTIFLDEIGTVDKKVQIILLRVIERKKLQRLGGRQTVSSDARVVAATNKGLEQAVQEGTFREDLYYRLNVFRITMPPLRERQGDVTLLIEHFLERYNSQFGKVIAGISPSCVTLLEAYPWPGNVRELKNVIQRAVLVCQGDVILPEHLPPRLRKRRKERTKVVIEVGTPLHEVEREMIIHALAAAGNNRTRAAGLLGISRRALYNKISRYGL